MESHKRSFKTLFLSFLVFLPIFFGPASSSASSFQSHKESLVKNFRAFMNTDFRTFAEMLPKASKFADFFVKKYHESPQDKSDFLGAFLDLVGEEREKSPNDSRVTLKIKLLAETILQRDEERTNKTFSARISAVTREFETYLETDHLTPGQVKFQSSELAQLFMKKMKLGVFSREGLPAIERMERFIYVHQLNHPDDKAFGYKLKVFIEDLHRLVNDQESRFVAGEMAGALALSAVIGGIDASMVAQELTVSSMSSTLEAAYLSLGALGSLIYKYGRPRQALLDELKVLWTPYKECNFILKNEKEEPYGLSSVAK